MFLRWGKRKNINGSVLDWEQTASHPRFSDDHMAIVRKESHEVFWLNEDMESKKLKWNQS